MAIPTFPKSQKPKFENPWIWKSEDKLEESESKKTIEMIENDLAHIRGEIERLSKENSELESEIESETQGNLLMKRSLSEKVKAPAHFKIILVWCRYC